MIFSLLMFSLSFLLIATGCVYLYMQNAVVSAARVGARAASVSNDLGGSNATSASTARSAIAQQVKTYLTGLAGSSGLDVPLGNIVLTGPTGTAGSRNVTVTITGTFKDPLSANSFISGLGGTGGSAYNGFPLSASATMRYEE
jgi:Flp pilus assembly protein TadG